ncbi:MAG: YARHG domain-containing protein [Rhodothermia bacterium]|nr:YARHG domain-containing protein [Rhodothermia bacterium]
MENENPNNASGQQTINVQVPLADNIASRRPLIPTSFALAIIFFFFTFCDFKCGGQKIGSVTGINLVTGTELKDNDMFTGRETEIPASMWAILSLGAAIIGLGAYLIKEKREALIGTGAGAIGAGSLIILQFVIKSAIDKEAIGQIDVDFQFPYWGALTALCVGGLISYLRMKKTHNIVVSVAPQPTTSSPLAAESITQPQATVSNVSQTNSFDIGEWVGKNKKTVFIGAGRVVGLLILIVAIKYVISLDFGKSKNNIESTQTTQPTYQERNTSNTQSTSSGKYQEASERVLANSDILKLNKYELKIMRNEIYARYGYIFKTADMKAYFESQSWYTPRYNDVTSFLTETEKRNIELIQRYE